MTKQSHGDRVEKRHSSSLAGGTEINAAAAAAVPVIIVHRSGRHNLQYFQKETDN